MYICRFCGKSFRRQCDCTTHEKYRCQSNPDRKEMNKYKIHKKAVCPICNGFFDVANIARHQACCGKRKPDNHVHLDHEGLECKYCGRLLKNRKSLIQHEIRCPQNPDRKAYTSLSTFIQDCVKGQTKDSCDSIARQANTIKASYRSGKINPYWLGKIGTFKDKHHKPSSKEQTRKSILKYLENTIEGFHSTYNTDACRYIDELNSKMGWHLQHAENGGEVGVGGYFMDGYDEELNIAFEYDEPPHYKNVLKNILRDKDVERMSYIMNLLKCRFFRYNEKLDLLYEVTDQS